MQLIQQELGGKVEPGESSEYGRTTIEVTKENLLFEGTPRTQTVWMSHGNKVTELAPGFETIACSDNCPFAAAQDTERKCTLSNSIPKFGIQNMEIRC